MTDRMISRRRLIEVVAGTLLLSGCAVQDDSSTKKAKKQGEKKAEASDGAKHLHDKDDLYEVYDDSGIVTMYLTVSRGNSSENTAIAGPRSTRTRSTTTPTWVCALPGYGLVAAGRRQGPSGRRGGLWRGSAQRHRAGARPNVEYLPLCLSNSSLTNRPKAPRSTRALGFLLPRNSQWPDFDTPRTSRAFLPLPGKAPSPADSYSWAYLRKVESLVPGPSESSLTVVSPLRATWAAAILNCLS